MDRKGYDIEIVTKTKLGKCQVTVRGRMIILVILTVMETETAGRGTITTAITMGEIRAMELSQRQTALRGNIPGTIRHTVTVIVTAIVTAIVIMIVIVNELKAVHFREDKWNHAKII